MSNFRWSRLLRQLARSAVARYRVRREGAMIDRTTFEEVVGFLT